MSQALRLLFAQTMAQQGAATLKSAATKIRPFESKALVTKLNKDLTVYSKRVVAAIELYAMVVNNKGISKKDIKMLQKKLPDFLPEEVNINSFSVQRSTINYPLTMRYLTTAVRKNIYEGRQDIITTLQSLKEFMNEDANKLEHMIEFLIETNTASRDLNLSTDLDDLVGVINKIDNPKETSKYMRIRTMAHEKFNAPAPDNKMSPSDIVASISDPVVTRTLKYNNTTMKVLTDVLLDSPGSMNTLEDYLKYKDLIKDKYRRFLEVAIPTLQYNNLIIDIQDDIVTLLG